MRNSTSWYLTKRHEMNMKVNKSTLKNVFRISNHNTPKLEKTRYSSTEEWMKKSGYVHKTRVTFSNKRNSQHTLTQNNLKNRPKE